MTTCMACGKPLEPGIDYPREKTVIYGVEVGPDTPIVCFDPVACLKRVDENQELREIVRKEFKR